MTKADLFEFLKDYPDDTPILIPFEGGFIAACMTDSGIAKDDGDEQIFVIMPCFCHLDEEITREVHSDDFEISKN